MMSPSSLDRTPSRDCSTPPLPHAEAMPELTTAPVDDEPITDEDIPY